MQMLWFFAPMSIRLFTALALFWFLTCASVVRASDGSPFLKMDAESCQKLDDKNLQVGPPDEEIVAACASLRRGAVFGQAYSGGPGALALSLLGFVLVYATIGAPIRGVAGLFGLSVGRSPGALSLEAALAFMLRSAISVAFLAVLALPFATAVGCVLMLTLLILLFRRSRVALSARLQGERTIASEPSSSSLVIADLINDACVSAPGILGLAILSRRDPWVLGLGVALAVPASAPLAIKARRWLRREQSAGLAAMAAMGAIFGAFAVADQDLAASLGDTLLPGALSGLAFAAALLAASWLGRERPQSNAGPA